jgi:hypothetical protein
LGNIELEGLYRFDFVGIGKLNANSIFNLLEPKIKPRARGSILGKVIQTQKTLRRGMKFGEKKTFIISNGLQPVLLLL